MGTEAVRNEAYTIGRATWSRGDSRHINDIEIDGDGQLAMVTGIEAYRQIIAATVMTRIDELPLDLDDGIDYFGTVFANNGYIPEWKSQVAEAVMALDFVREIESFDVSMENGNTLSYRMTVTTDIGEVTINGAG